MPDHRRLELETLEGQTYSGFIKQEAAEQIHHIVDSGRPILGRRWRYYSCSEITKQNDEADISLGRVPFY